MLLLLALALTVVLREHRLTLAPIAVVPVAAAEVGYLPIGKRPDARGELLYKITVVRDEEQRLLIVRERVLHPFAAVIHPQLPEEIYCFRSKAFKWFHGLKLHFFLQIRNQLCDRHSYLFHGISVTDSYCSVFF